MPTDTKGVFQPLVSVKSMWKQWKKIERSGLSCSLENVREFIYSPIVIMSPGFSFETKGKQRRNGLLVLPTILCSVCSVCIMKVYTNKVLSMLGFVRSFFPQHHSKFIANVAFINVSWACTKERWTSFSICKVNFTFVQSFRDFKDDTGLVVDVSFWMRVLMVSTKLVTKGYRPASR